MRDIFDQVSPEDAELLRRDLTLYGTCYVKDGKRVSPRDVHLQPPDPGSNEIRNPWLP